MLTRTLSPLLALLLAASSLAPMGHAEKALPGPAGGVEAALAPGLEALPSRFSFEKNLGQWDPEALYLARGIGYDAFLAADKLVMDFARPAAAAVQPPTDSFPPAEPGDVEHLAVMMRFVGANPAPAIAADGELGQKTSHFFGNDSAAWVADAPHFERVTYGGLYPGIDLAFYEAEGGGLKYDFIVAPGADASLIRLAFDGVDAVGVDPDGRLALQTPFGTFHQGVPTTYQAAGGQLLDVPNRYVAEGNEVRFEVAGHDASLPLVIDPLIVGTYIGGSGDDQVNDLELDSGGNIWVVGQTVSTNYPTTPYVYRTSGGSSTDAFISKLNPAGTSLLVSSYFGTTSTDIAMALDFDDYTGYPYVTGYTSTLFSWPSSSDAYQRYSMGGYDGFLIAFLPTLNMVYESTLFGGSGTDQPFDMDMGGSFMANIAGVTTSLNFPAQYGTQLMHGGGTWDGFAISITPQLLGWSTYIGGSGDDYASRIVDRPGESYVAGYTNSANFPTTAGAHRTTPAGGNDAFVQKLDGNLRRVWSTLLGGSLNDYLTLGGLEVDASGNVFLAGSTSSTNFPVTAGAYDTLLGGTSDAYVAQLDPTGSSVVASTYLGGAADEYSRGLELAGADPVVLLSTTSLDYPATAGANRTANSGSNDMALTKLASGVSGLLYSSYMGGLGAESPMSLLLDSAGAAYLAGYTVSTNYPVTAGAFRATSAGAKDGFVTKMTMVPDPPNPPRSLASACNAPYGLVLSWQAPSYTAGVPLLAYRVYRSDDFVNFAQIGELSGTSLTHIPPWNGDWGLSQYRVTAVTVYGEGLPAQANFSTCDLVPPTCTGSGYTVEWTKALPTLSGPTCTDGYAGLSSASACTNLSPWTCKWVSLYGTPDYGTLGPLSPSFALTSLPNGVNSITFKMHDRGGQIHTISGMWTVKYDTVGPVLSTASSTHPSETLYYSRGTLSATVSATDAGVGVKGIYWHLTASDTCPGDITAFGTYTAGSSVALTQPVPGPFEAYSLCAQGIDLLDTASGVKRYAVNVDTGLPTLQSVTSGTVNANAVFTAAFNDKDGGLDNGEATKVDVASIVLKIDGVDIRATYGQACPPTGTLCRLVVTQNSIEWDPPTPWAAGSHTRELTLKDTTVDKNTLVSAGSFTATV